MNFHVWHTLVHDTTQNYDRTSPNDDAWTEHGFGTDPSPPFANDGPPNQLHVHRRPIVIASA